MEGVRLLADSANGTAHPNVQFGLHIARSCLIQV